MARLGSIGPRAPETCHIPFRMLQMSRSGVSCKRLDAGSVIFDSGSSPDYSTRIPPHASFDGRGMRTRGFKGASLHSVLARSGRRRWMMENLERQPPIIAEQSGSDRRWGRSPVELFEHQI